MPPGAHHPDATALAALCSVIHARCASGGRADGTAAAACAALCAAVPAPASLRLALDLAPGAPVALGTAVAMVVRAGGGEGMPGGLAGRAGRALGDAVCRAGQGGTKTEEGGEKRRGQVVEEAIEDAVECCEMHAALTGPCLDGSRSWAQEVSLPAASARLLSG